MDREKLNYYDRQAAEVAAKYRVVDQSAWRQQFREAFPAGGQLALRTLDDAHKEPKAKCPFVPQREMVEKLWGARGGF